MATPIWPKDKGWCLADGYNEKFPKLAMRSEVDAGPVKQRRVAVSAPSTVVVRYLMTSAERTWLETFFKTDAAGGGVWFEWWHPVKLAWYLARFVVDQEPEYEPKKPDWVASVTLEYR